MYQNTLHPSDISINSMLEGMFKVDFTTSSKNAKISEVCANYGTWKNEVRLGRSSNITQMASV